MGANVGLWQKIKLFFKLGDRPFWLLGAWIVSILLHWYLSSDAALGIGLEMFLKLLIFLIPVAIGFVWLKMRRGLKAITEGARREAIVLGVFECNSGFLNDSEDEDQEPRYVLDWQDEDGDTGSSIPGCASDFAGYENGDRIIVYKNDQHDSWWEQDVFGPSHHRRPNPP